MLTIKKVAHRWSVSPGMIYKLVAEGKLPCHRIGSAIRFEEDHLHEFLTHTEQEPQPKQSLSHLDL